MLSSIVNSVLNSIVNIVLSSIVNSVLSSIVNSVLSSVNFNDWTLDFITVFNLIECHHIVTKEPFNQAHKSNLICERANTKNS